MKLLISVVVHYIMIIIISTSFGLYYEWEKIPDPIFNILVITYVIGFNVGPIISFYFDRRFSK